MVFHFREVHHLYLGQAVDTAREDQVVFKYPDASDGLSRNMGDKVPPVIPGGRRYRCFGDFEILGSISVVADQKTGTVVGDIVLNILLPWLDQRELSVRVAGVQKMPLRHVIAGGNDIDEPLALGFDNVDEESLIQLLVY